MHIIIELVYTTTKKDNKTYTNYYLKLANGELIPICVKKFEGYEDVVGYQYAKLSAVAKKCEGK